MKVLHCMVSDRQCWMTIMGVPDILVLVASQTSVSKVIWLIFHHSGAQVQAGLWYSHLMALVTVCSNYFTNFVQK